MKIGIMAMTVLLLSVALLCNSVRSETWHELTPLPDKEGFAGSFAGVSHGVLLVAGGANFPEKKPWEGGEKIWYDHIFALQEPRSAWKQVGRLPRPLGYGVSVSHGESVICVGGSDARGHRSEAFRLEYRAGQVVVTDMPPLPVTLANMAGALVGDCLYIAGGQETPTAAAASAALWRLDLAEQEPRWQRLAPLPGDGRMLSAAASARGSFWLFGGVTLVPGNEGQPVRRYLREAYCFEPQQGWRKLADLPTPVAAAPSPAPSEQGHMMLLGGDDGSQVGVPHDVHRGFQNTVLRYDTKSDTWGVAETLPAPRVTAPCVAWRNLWVVPSGEMRPGVRSPQVWAKQQNLWEQAPR
jgi:N-acetylneuraminic acid mutarotase